MITLAAWRKMVYFFYLQAPFTGGEDGIQAVPRGKLSGSSISATKGAMYVVVLAIFAGRLSPDPPHGAFPVRPGAQGDPQRTSRAHLSLGYDVNRYKLLAYRSVSRGGDQRLVAGEPRSRRQDGRRAACTD